MEVIWKYALIVTTTNFILVIRNGRLPHNTSIKDRTRVEGTTDEGTVRGMQDEGNRIPFHWQILELQG